MLEQTATAVAAANPEIHYPELPPAMRRGGLCGAMRVFGPGAIIASVTIGSGETLFASRTGAIFGYGLLWFVAMCVVCKLVPVYTGARYMVLSGEHPMEAWARLPGPHGWFPILLGTLSFFCFPFWMGGLSMMVGTAINWIVGFDGRDLATQQFYARIFGTALLSLVMVLVLLQSYRTLERVQIAIVSILLLSILGAMVMAPVNWGEVLRGTFTMGGLSYPDWIGEKFPRIASTSVLVTLTTFMGAIGGGTYDYIGYLSLFREKRWGALGVSDGASAERPVIANTASNLSAGRCWLRAPGIDVFTGFGCVMIFTMAFTILGASVLHPRHDVPADFALLSPQAQFLTQFGQGFKYLYQLGIFMAFWGTIYGGLEVYCRTGYECFRPLSSRVRQAAYERFRPPVCLYAGLVGIALMWLVERPMDIVAPAALLGSLTCGLWCFAIIWADRRTLPRGVRMGPGWIVLNLLSGLILTGFGVGGVVVYVQSLMERWA
jgi:Mn2+/Fe2+ NRAMP family transporter